MTFLRAIWPKIRRRLPALALLALTLFLIWTAFGTRVQDLLPMVRRGDKHAIVTYISEDDAFAGMICVMLLSGLQVASIVLPGIVIHVAAGVLYSWWKAFLLCYTGFIIGCMAVFLFVRRMREEGKSIKVNLSPTGKKILEMLSGTPTMLVVIVIYMIPGIPNGIVPYIAVKRNMKPERFFIGTAFGSWLQILCSCVAGNFLIQGSILSGILVIVVQWAVLGLMLWKRDLLLKWLT
ncbi:MAG: VTT domain-containing protein [Clostridium sp.]|nr:VTT domain-containing protein [Clostridium sp.]